MILTQNSSVLSRCRDAVFETRILPWGATLTVLPDAGNNYSPDIHVTGFELGWIEQQDGTGAVRLAVHYNPDSIDTKTYEADRFVYWGTISFSPAPTHTEELSAGHFTSSVIVTQPTEAYLDYVLGVVDLFARKHCIAPNVAEELRSLAHEVLGGRVIVHGDMITLKRTAFLPYPMRDKRLSL